MVITNQPNPLYDTFIEPFHQGIDNIRAGFEGKRVEQVFQQAVGDLRAPREIDLTLLDRIGAVVVGIMLLIPLINAVVFQILRVIESPLVFQRDANPAPGGQAPYVPGGGGRPAQAPVGMGELYLQRRSEGLCLAPEMPVAQEAAATPEEYIRRKEQAVAALVNYPANGPGNLECTNEVNQYNLDDVLGRFSPDHNPERLAELYDFAEVEGHKRWGLNANFNRYNGGHISDQQREAKNLLSRLFDFFNRNRALFPAGSEQEGLFKAQIRDTFDRINDAHNNCVDQVLSQLESIVCDVIADFESIRVAGAQTMLDRLRNRTAFTLFKYKANLIRNICVAEYPAEPHMADMERLVKQSLAGMAGMQGGVLQVGAQYENVIRFPADKIENIVNIFMFGEASATRLAQDAAAGGGGANAARRRLESIYEPEAYLIEALRTYHGAERTLRNDLLLWARDHFNIATDIPATTNFVRAFSAEPDELDMENGGNLTHQGLLYLLEQTRILRYRAPA